MTQPFVAFDNSLSPLQFESLGNAGATVENSDSELSSIINDLQAHVQKQKWLLEKDQHASFPSPDSNLLEDYLSKGNSKIFSLADFYREHQEFLLKDVQDTAKHANGIQPEQLEELYRTGQLVVKSYHFKDQKHVWQLHPSFYTGTKPKRERFQEGVGRTLDHLMIHTQDAVLSKEGETSGPSLRKSITGGFFKGLSLFWKSLVHQLLSLGPAASKRPKYSDGTIEEILLEARRLYVNQHHPKNEGLEAKEWIYRDPEGPLPVPSFQWNALRHDAQWGQDMIPSDETFEVQTETTIRRKVHDKCVQIDADFRRRKKTEEYQVSKSKLRQSPLAALQEKRRADKEWEDQMQRNMIEKLYQSDDIHLNSEGHRRSVEAIRRQLEQEVRAAREKLVEEYRDELRLKKPIASLSKMWMQRRLALRELAIQKQQGKSLGTRVLEKIREEGMEELLQPMLLREKFWNEEAPIITERLRQVTVRPDPIRFRILKLNRNNWFQDELGRYREVLVDYSQRFWRAKYLWYTFLSMTLNLSAGSYHFLLSGPLSFRALFQENAFYAFQKPGDDGDLIDDPTSLTPTYRSRLRSFFDSLQVILDDFEMQEDRGIIGKSIQRAFLRCYLTAKKVIGAMSITTFMAGVTVISSILMMGILLASPIIAAASTAILELFNFFIVDTALPDARPSPFLNVVFGVPYYIIGPGLFQAAAAGCRLVLHPLIALANQRWCTIRFLWTSCRDIITWLLIRKYARIPAADTFLGRRIHGPGLASQYFYKLPQRAAFLALQTFLEYGRLAAYSKFRESEVLLPFGKMDALMNELVEPLDYRASKRSLRPQDLSNQLIAMYRSKGNIRNKARPMMQQSYSPMGDFWTTLAFEMREAHPDYRTPQPASEEAPLRDSEQYESSILRWLKQNHTLQTRYASESSKRAGLYLAELHMLADFRKSRMMAICALPSEARDRFRLPKKEMQELWEESLELTRLYLSTIRLELVRLASESCFRDDLIPIAKDLADSIWRDAGAEPGENVEIVASHILSLVFGGEITLKPMEDVDKELLLIPNMSPEDKHLDFFGWNQESPEYVLVES